MVENKSLFGITIEDLLTIDGVRLSPSKMDRKVVVKERTAILTEIVNREGERKWIKKICLNV